MSDFKIDLVEIFHKLNGHMYCIIKLSEDFPEYEIGSDLDLFCFKIDQVAAEILGAIEQYVDEGISIQTETKSAQIHLDIMEGDYIHLRFDLYGALPAYKNIAIKPGFFSTVVENSVSLDKKGIMIPVPSAQDEALLRYIEYQEFYAARPDKIKHIDYIHAELVKSHIHGTQLIDRLHHYTELPSVAEPKGDKPNKLVELVNYYRWLFDRGYEMVRARGLRYTFARIYTKSFK